MDKVNLLTIPDRISNAPRALWTNRILGEHEAPEKRIIHSRCLQSDQAFQIDRIGIQLGLAFLKCGSALDGSDWIRNFRVLVLTNEHTWQEVLSVEDVPCPTPEEPIRYYELNHQSYRAVLVEIRRTGIDSWWPSWNISMDGFILEGTVADAKEKIFPSHYELLVLEDCSIQSLPAGVQATVYDNEIRYSNDRMEVGFNLTKTGFSYLAIYSDQDGNPPTRNLLQYPTMDNWSIHHSSPNGGFWRRHMDLTQGLSLYSYGNHEQVGHYQQDYQGKIQIRNNQVTYLIEVPRLKQKYRITWVVEKDRLVLDVERDSEETTRLWSSSIWSMSLASRVSPATVVGKINHQGQASTLQYPVYFHAPAFGSLRVDLHQGDGLWRFDSIRPAYTVLHEIKCGEILQPEGDYVLPKGKHHLQLSFTPEVTQIQPIQKQTPEIVQRAVNHCTMTGLSFRPDLASLSNNGNSIHATTCMEHWSSLCIWIDRFKPEYQAKDLMRLSLERWLLDGTAYCSGRSFVHDGWIEDEYMMAGASSVLGLALYMVHMADQQWINTYQSQIYDKIDQLLARDLDGDGLIETPVDKRTGVSGLYEWSSNWYDIISYGWKDAFANALYYQALCVLDQVQSRFLDPKRQIDFKQLASQVKKSYIHNFYNEKTGWFAGWRCKEDKLHDYAFLVVNGAASTCGILDDQPELHRSIIEKLYQEIHRMGFRAFRYGLPGNLWNIPGTDTAAMSHHRPLGAYQNGGATLSQSRFFLTAMYRVGLQKEADHFLEKMCEGIMHGEAFAGCASGIDWRMWDGSPTGYEGILTDQFGILIPIFERYYNKSDSLVATS